MNSSRFSRFIIHPILMALFPVLSMYFANRWIVPPIEAWIMMGIMVLFAVLAWTILNLILQNKEKSAILVSIFIFLMFTLQNLIYGTNVLYLLLGPSAEIETWITSDSVLIFWSLMLLVIFGLICHQVINGKWNNAFLSSFFNVFSIGLILITILSWIPAEINRATRQKSLVDPFDTGWNAMVQNEPCILHKKSEHLPDIYVIILDSYLRDDVLRDIYGIDNSSFITGLEQRGFYVARNSRSNNTHTALTVSSMLNFDYLESMAKTSGLDTLAESHLGTMVHNNRAFHQLDCLGYKVTTLTTGFYYTDFPDSDRIISTGTYPSNFAFQLAASTPLTLVTLGEQYNTLRERMFSTFEEIQKVPQSDDPQFIYAHLMFGHPPFLFNSKGEEVDPLREMRFDSTHYFKSQVIKDDFVNEYKNQVTYLSGKVLDTVDGILANSDEPPIIIMMGDHGPSFLDASNWERFSIFNAYYFPGQKTTQLYQGITPVNSLRVVFDTYFDAGLPLLPDTSNLAPPNNLYETLDVSKSIPDNVK